MGFQTKAKIPPISPSIKPIMKPPNAGENIESIENNKTNTPPILTFLISPVQINDRLLSPVFHIYA
jgi:hypothetical protein